MNLASTLQILLKRWHILKKSLLIVLGVMVAFLTACAESPPTGNTGTTEPANPPSETVETVEQPAAQVLRVALQSDGKTLDPHVATDAGSIHMIENMYNSLMEYTATYGEVIPGLAEGYTISDDQLTYTFKLRAGVKFHNSEKEMTSEDVKYSIERIIEQNVRASQFSMIDTMETPDAQTIVFKLKQPMAPFLTSLGAPMNAVVNKDAVEANGGSLDNVDAGTGPFQLVEWKKDQELVLEKNPNYFEAGLPYLDQLILKPIPDETARTTAIRNGEIDLILETSAKENELLANADGVTLKSVPGTFWEYIGLNTKDPILSDVKVRQAIAHAVDRNQINQMVKFGKATVLEGGNITPIHWANADLHTYASRDVAKAKALLAEAGKPSINLVLKVGSAFDYQVQAAQIVKQQLAEVGIKVTVDAQESGVFFDALGKGEFQMTIVGWQGFVDPDEFVYNLFHTGEAWNQQGYSNAQVDALLEQGRTTTGDEARKAIYDQIQTIIVDEAPMVFLYVNERTAAYRDNVAGFEVEPTVSSISLKKTKIE
jgi:peptide/nickel transport system substrate-binding protein